MISYHCQLQSLFDKPVFKTWKKTTRLPPLFWSFVGESTSDQWHHHTKGQQCEKHSCNSWNTRLRLCHQYYGKKYYAQQWQYVSITGFHLTGSCTVFPTTYTRKQWNKTLKFRTTDPLWGEPTDDQWTCHTKGQQCENINPAISRPQVYLCSSTSCKETDFPQK